jgi:hypothetical protein
VGVEDRGSVGARPSRRRRTLAFDVAPSPGKRFVERPELLVRPAAGGVVNLERRRAEQADLSDGNAGRRRQAGQRSAGHGGAHAGATDGRGFGSFLLVAFVEVAVGELAQCVDRFACLRT